MRFKLYCLGTLLTFMTFTGVYATWRYVNEPSMTEQQIQLQLVDFFWQGAEDLPELDNIGENHIALIERLTISDYGMNNANSFLSDYIDDRIKDSKDTVSSVAPTPGGNLKDLFNTSEMQKLDFMMQLTLSSSKEIIGCELYTFQTNDLGNSIGKEVDPVYKTVLKNENGKWIPERTYAGKSVSMKYDAKQGGTRITIDPKKWVET